MTEPSRGASDGAAGPSRELTHPWHRYVAIGDSFTEGMSDADPARPGAYVGWADRLAAHLGGPAARAGEEFGYANLAVRGRLLADVAGPQTEAAIALAPDLVSIVGGGNDLLRRRPDVDALAVELEDAVARLRAAGAAVLMATPTDPKDAPVLRATRGRAATYVAHIWSIARRQRAYVLDLWGLQMLRDWRMWAEDRIHLTSEGHRRVALAASESLGLTPEDVEWSTPLPPAPPIARREAMVSNARWARQYVGPWVHRRLRGTSSGDLVTAKRPQLVPLDGELPARVGDRTAAGERD